MSLKKLGLVVVMTAALFAVFAGSSSGAIIDHLTTITTKKAEWNSGGTPFGNSEATGKTPKCSAATNFVLKGTILGSEAELTATGMSCSGKLWNEGTGESAMAVGKGTLSFTGITVNKPSGCKLNGEANGSAKLTTESLTLAIDMHDEIEVETEPAGVVKKESVPKETQRPVATFKSVGEKFTSIKLTGCAAEGSYKVTGTAIGEASNNTGVSASNQPLAFNATTNAAGSLTLAGNPATITGTANNELSGGEAFQVN
ncbi:MAG TPA: hypothetical protein VN522_05785 [Solirubrobacterales bacterium]|nr:hypothetical protein [Solirubrobacterales bacterium]